MEEQLLFKFKKKRLEQMIGWEARQMYAQCSLKVFRYISLWFVALFILTNQSFIPNHFLTWTLGGFIVFCLLIIEKLKPISYWVAFLTFVPHLWIIDFNYYRREFEWFPTNENFFYRIGLVVVLGGLLWGFVESLMGAFLIPLFEKLWRKKLKKRFAYIHFLMEESTKIRKQFESLPMKTLCSMETEDDFERVRPFFDGTYLEMSGPEWFSDILVDFPISELELLEIETLAEFLSYFRIKEYS